MLSPPQLCAAQDLISVSWQREEGKRGEGAIFLFFYSKDLEKGHMEGSEPGQGAGSGVLLPKSSWVALTTQVWALVQVMVN